MSWKGWILLDEISMVSVPLLAVLDQLRLNGTKICSFGDWAQLEPHPESNSWRGTVVEPDAFQKSRMYKLWSECTMFELRRCRRSDKAHFDFYCGLSQDVGTAIRESRKRHPPADDADLHICISHKRRKLISQDKQIKFTKGKNVC